MFFHILHVVPGVLVLLVGEGYGKAGFNFLRVHVMRGAIVMPLVLLVFNGNGGDCG